MTTKSKTAKAEMTASESYKAKRQEVDRLLIDLKAALRKEAKQQQQDSGNWGYTGNIGYVAEQLKQLVKFANGK